MKNLKNIVNSAKGAQKSDLVLTNLNIVNVLTEEIYTGDIAIKDGNIVGIGNYKGFGDREVDFSGKYACPGLLDAHIHIESSMVTPSLYAQAVLPRGTTGIITDPHEIANVCGLDGINFMINDSKELPIDVYFMAPSCVPATPFETSGATLEAAELEEVLKNDKVIGLAEMMNYPGVLNCDEKILKKLTLFESMNIDGHAPGLSGKNLNAYVAAGIKTDHECSTQKELIEKARAGMYIAVREGSAAKNLEEMLKGIERKYLKRCMFCTDDMHIEDIVEKGNIDNSIRKAISLGISPIDAISMATINTANCYGLKNTGAIAPGYKADIAIFDNLKDFNIENVYKNGKLVAKNKNCIYELRKPIFDSKVRDTVRIKKLSADDIKLKLDSQNVKVIKMLPGSILTEKANRNVDISNGCFEYNTSKDIVKLVVVERHKNTGNVAIGLIEDFGIKNGAIAMTIAHDSHNIVAAGTNDTDILKAIGELKKSGGGIAISSNNEIIGSLKLPIAGLMTDENLKTVAKGLKELHNIAYDKLHVNKEINPFTTLSFISLSVIPSLRLTDKGLFDVDKFDFVDICNKNFADTITGPQ